jgi:hypothetical protein
MADQVTVGYSPEEMRTDQPTGAAKLKWIVAVDRSLSPGQATNAATCVSAATALAVGGLLGPGSSDASGGWHPGLPWAGSTILAANAVDLADLREKAIAGGLLVIDMPAVAQTSRVYDDYLDELAKTPAERLALLAVSVIGPRNRVAKLVRRLELLP